MQPKALGARHAHPQGPGLLACILAPAPCKRLDIYCAHEGRNGGIGQENEKPTEAWRGLYFSGLLSRDLYVFIDAVFMAAVIDLSLFLFVFFLCPLLLLLLMCLRRCWRRCRVRGQAARTLAIDPKYERKHEKWKWWKRQQNEKHKKSANPLRVVERVRVHW